ncbi:MAG: glycoside hydrolase family 127 protein [Candidatus Omnitrophica bacterium]|nr:glycoside hydrolase family 127 protein [Candidatus Omnitrophota bacterium]
MVSVNHKDVVINDKFWSSRINVNRKKTIPHIYKQLEKTGRIDAFKLNKNSPMHIFWDSDVYKWIEAASYSLTTHTDIQIDSMLNHIVNLIVQAQQPDGYLNTYLIAKEPENRWKNLRDNHELYTAGHLIESAVAHYQYTGKNVLLDVACRFADYIETVFGRGDNKKPGYCGHPEIELALVRLYRTTGEKRYLNLSKYFVEQRGQKPYYFKEEAIARGEDLKKWYSWETENYAIFQAHLPVRQQYEASGHAVRAAYLYSAMADMALETKDISLFKACDRLWENIVIKKMYITGGIGSSKNGEKFTSNYDLPNEEAYCEICASIGLMLFSHRMLSLNCDRKYADVMEKALYNGILSGVSLNGTRFFYVNPLTSLGNHHRQEWFDCACCPPNIARILASLGQYIYSQNKNNIIVHLYIGSSAGFNIKNQKIILKQKTDYPWNGMIGFTFKMEKSAYFGLKLRIPGWSQKAKLNINGVSVKVAENLEKGYIHLERNWQNNDTITLEFDMPIIMIQAHPDVRQDIGYCALQRGPVVYCMEEVDNNVPLHRIILNEKNKYSAVIKHNLLGGIVTIRGKSEVVDDAGWNEMLYKPLTKEKFKQIKVTAVPYYTWDNRKQGQMRVWFRYK